MTTIGQVDPMELSGLVQVMNSNSFKVYKNSWLEFVHSSKISIEKEPVEADFDEYFSNKRSGGLSGNTLKSFYSHLNKCYTHLYNQSLGVSLFYK